MDSQYSGGLPTWLIPSGTPEELTICIALFVIALSLGFFPCDDRANKLFKYIYYSTIPAYVIVSLMFASNGCNVKSFIRYVITIGVLVIIQVLISLITGKIYANKPEKPFSIH